MCKDTVHRVRQRLTVEMDAGRLGQVVLEAMARTRSPSVTRSSGPGHVPLNPSASSGSLTTSMRCLITSTVSSNTLTSPSRVGSSGTLTPPSVAPSPPRNRSTTALAWASHRPASSRGRRNRMERGSGHCDGTGVALGPGDPLAAATADAEADAARATVQPDRTIAAGAQAATPATTSPAPAPRRKPRRLTGDSGDRSAGRGGGFGRKHASSVRDDR